MPHRQALPERAVLRRRRLSPIDALVALGILALLYGLVRLGKSITVDITPGSSTEHLSTNLVDVPYYAAQSLLRMFIALGLSTVFTFVYGVAAARLKRAEKVLVPVLDILQSIPILVFLPIALTFFVNLFDGRIIGFECASIFVIFTSQAWNMTFSFYHSLVTQPPELDEAARMYRLTKWQRFWKLDVPSSMIGLVWNAMMSMGGGWFFLTASEAVTVFIGHKGRNVSLPGIGSYMAAAVQEGSVSKVCIAIGAMVVIVVGTNFFVFRPLVAWSEKFRMETSDSGDQPRSVVLGVLRRSSVPRTLGRATHLVARALDSMVRPFGVAEHPLHPDVRRGRFADLVFWGAVTVAVVAGGMKGFIYLDQEVGFGRVVVLIAISTLIWVPIGAKIGMDRRLARYAQPVVQVLASFPAILLFPFVTVAFITLHIPLNIGAILLMMLGAQWYILFNVIAGASAIPNDLREMATNLQLTRRQRWTRVILPAIFPYYVTGGITAAGGAWNASIVAEVVSWHGTTLSSFGLGSYLAHASAHGDFGLLVAGGVVMSTFVVAVNRLFWRHLYHLAETRYSL
jgi:NitT/TauT family transport system permease protein